MMKDNIFYRIVAVLLIIAMGYSFAGCNKQNQVPAKEEILAICQADSDPHGIKKYNFTRQDLLDSWGTPIAGDSLSYRLVWSCNDKYLVAEFSSDDAEKIECLYVSFSQELVYLFSNATVIYVSRRDGGVTDYDSCLMLPEQWFSQEMVSNLEPGSVIQIEFDGNIMETFPEQINEPFSFKVSGKVLDSEMETLEKQARYIRDNYTGEQG